MILAAVTVDVAEIVKAAAAPAVAALALLLGPRIVHGYQHRRFLAEQRLDAYCRLYALSADFHMEALEAFTVEEDPPGREEVMHAWTELVAARARVEMLGNAKVAAASREVADSAMELVGPAIDHGASMPLDEFRDIVKALSKARGKFAATAAAVVQTGQ